jgi:quercetin dioxygenase-like cupin family protein
VWYSTGDWLGNGHGGCRHAGIGGAEGQTVPWHYHSEITECFFCVDGTLVVETRAPRAVKELTAGEWCSVPPKTAHRVLEKHEGHCRYLLLQGVGVYDFLPVGN